MKIVFFSDAHLNRENNNKSTFLIDFINDICMNADIIVILGDLFEFYHGYDGYIYPWYKEAVDALKNIAEKGKNVYFIEGNHEFGMGNFFETYTGIICLDNLTLSVDNIKIYIAHGHEIKNNLLVKFLKTPFIYWIMNTFGPSLTWNIAEISGYFLSRKNKPYSRKAFNMFRQFAQKKLDEGYDVLILGHSHIPDKFDISTGDIKKYYLNTGDIINSASYVEYNSKEGFELKKYSRTAYK